MRKFSLSCYTQIHDFFPRTVPTTFPNNLIFTLCTRVLADYSSLSCTMFRYHQLPYTYLSYNSLQFFFTKVIGNSLVLLHYSSEKSYTLPLPHTNEFSEAAFPGPFILTTLRAGSPGLFYIYFRPYCRFSASFYWPQVLFAIISHTFLVHPSSHLAIRVRLYP